MAKKVRETSKSFKYILSRQCLYLQITINIFCCIAVKDAIHNKLKQKYENEIKN